jgi:acetyl esterase/lipase
MRSRPYFVALASLAVLSIATGIAQAADVSERFRRFDVNGDGKLTRDEFPSLMQPLFDRLDANSDNVITTAEDAKFSMRVPIKALQPVQPPETVRVELDIPYAATENSRQRLDLYLPKQRKSSKPLPVVVHIHGGGWQFGSKGGGYRYLGPLVESGEYAGVSIGYRLTNEASWPAQIHDCKAAIRWLRGNAAKYNLDPDRIGVTGTSAGGHLGAMLGTSGDDSSMEGTLGEHTKLSSRVTCVVDHFGPSDFRAFVMVLDPTLAVTKLLGGPPKDKLELAHNASPVTHVSTGDAPFLLIHGTRDPIVPFGQSEVLHAALVKAQVDATLIPVEGGGHGNFGSPEVTTRMRKFFDKHLRGEIVSISGEPIQLGDRQAPGGK